MLNPRPWDEVDRTLLAACRRPGTINRLVHRTGLPGDLVKGLVAGYEQAGLVARCVLGIRYQLTPRGLRHLHTLTPAPTTRKAA